MPDRPHPLPALAVALAAAVLSPRLAHAERALVLPHGGDADLTAERKEAARAVHEALQGQGFQTQSYAEAARRKPAVEATGCRRIACAPALLRAADVELAAAVAVWRSENGLSVVVTLTDAGGRYPGEAAVTPRGVAAAAEHAVLQARALQLLGPGPWLDVRGEPEGAEVLIDGTFAGTLPYRGPLPSGDHELVVRADGYAPLERTVEQPLDPTHITELHLALEPLGARIDPLSDSARDASPDRASQRASEHATLAATEPAPAPASEPSFWNYVAGSALIAGGLVVGTVDPIRAAARDGDCVDDACNEVYRFGTESALKVAAGAALIGAGVTLMIWRPLRVETELGPGRAGLHLHMRF